LYVYSNVELVILLYVIVGLSVSQGELRALYTRLAVVSDSSDYAARKTLIEIVPIVP
jgi:hypothetical protein